MGISVACMVAALILYTLAVWSEWAAKKLTPWMVSAFLAGFTSDLLGTSYMIARAIPKSSISVHAFFGCAALLIMFLHALWALFALAERGRAEEYFTRFSRFAWALWVVAFVTGIPK